jgi:hypothetical protein
VESAAAAAAMVKRAAILAVRQDVI